MTTMRHQALVTDMVTEDMVDREVDLAEVVTVVAEAEAVDSAAEEADGDRFRTSTI